MARLSAALSPVIVKVGTSVRPSRLAASKRAWPARMMAVSSIRIGLVQTRSMLRIRRAIWSSGCRRGFPRNGFRSPIASQTILSFSPRGAVALGAPLGVAGWATAVDGIGATCWRVSRAVLHAPYYWIAGAKPLLQSYLARFHRPRRLVPEEWQAT